MTCQISVESQQTEIMYCVNTCQMSVEQVTNLNYVYNNIMQKYTRIVYNAEWFYTVCQNQIACQLKLCSLHIPPNVSLTL